MDKVEGKLQEWKGKMLPYSGKEVHIISVLQSIPLYVLSTIIPLKCVLKDLHRIFAKIVSS